MSLVKSILIGAAAGAVISYFLKKDNGKLLNQVTDTYSNGVRNLSNNLKARVDNVEHFVKNGIDNAASRIAV